MSRVHHVILKARRRSLVDRSLRLGGHGTLVGAMLGIGLLVADRALGLAAPIWLYIALIAVPAAIGALRAAATLPGTFEFARRLDRTLHLKDRIATAHVLSDGASARGLASDPSGGRLPRTDDDFAALVQRDAEKLAGSIDARSAAPIRLTGVWGGALALTAALALGILYLPPLAWGGEGPSPEQQALAVEDAREREELREDIERVIENLREEAIVDDRARERLEALERLREQLLADDQSTMRESRALREETAAHMNELAERLAEQAHREALAAEELAERFAKLETPEAPMSAAEFDEAMRRGDFGRAAESLEELLRQRESLSPEERREMAQHLREMSERIERAGDSDRQELEERRAHLEQALRDHGIDEEAIRELMEALHEDDVPREEFDRRLHEEMTDEETAQRLARELDRLREQQRIEDRIEEDAKSVSDSLREAADEMESPGEPETREQDEAQPGEEQRDPAEREERTQEEREREEGEPQPGQQQQPDEQREGDQPAEQREGGQQEEQREGEQPGEEREGAAPDPDGEEPAVRPAPGESEAEDETAEAAAEHADEQADETAEQPRRRGDNLRDIDERRQAVERRRQASERLREESRRMADPQRSEPDRPRPDQPSPHGDPAARADEVGGSDAGADDPRTPIEGDPTRFDPLDIEDLDARAPDDGDPGEVIAEWLSDDARELEPGAARTGDPQQRVRQAQRIAERAVDEQAVPARYHDAIRRYFGRLNQTVERAKETSGPARETTENNP